MLYVLHGTDTKKVRSKLTSLVEALQLKKPDAVLLRIKPENWSEGFLDELLSSNALFAPKNILIFDSLFSDKEISKNFSDHISELSKSEHICIVVDEKILAADLKKLTSKAEKVQEFNLEDDQKEGTGFGKPAAKQMPKTFAFADALASKNKKIAWLTLQKLMKDSIAAEEIHGVLWWQFKSVYLSSLCKNAKDAGLNPYVYSKCSGFLKFWKDGEIEEYLQKLVSMYHNAHRGEIDFYAELELLCL